MSIEHTKAKVKHTALPWLLRKFGHGTRETFVTDATPDFNGGFVGQVVAARKTCPIWDANAELIVNAVNSHAALLSACRAMIDASHLADRLRSTEADDKMAEAQKFAIDGIRQAEGKPPLSAIINATDAEVTRIATEMPSDKLERMLRNANVCTCAYIYRGGKAVEATRQANADCPLHGVDVVSD